MNNSLIQKTLKLNLTEILTMSQRHFKVILKNSERKINYKSKVYQKDILMENKH